MATLLSIAPVGEREGALRVIRSHSIWGTNGNCIVPLILSHPETPFLLDRIIEPEVYLISGTGFCGVGGYVQLGTSIGRS